MKIVYPQLNEIKRFFFQHYLIFFSLFNRLCKFDCLLSCEWLNFQHNCVHAIKKEKNLKKFQRNQTWQRDHWVSVGNSSLMKFCCNQQFMVKITSGCFVKLSRDKTQKYLSQWMNLPRWDLFCDTAKWENWKNDKRLYVNSCK